MVSPRRVTFQRAGNPRRFQGRISASFWLQRLLTLGTSCSFSNFPTRALVTPNLNCLPLARSEVIFAWGPSRSGSTSHVTQEIERGLMQPGQWTDDTSMAPWVRFQVFRVALSDICFFTPLGVLCSKDNTKLSEDIVSVRRFDMAYVCAQARKLPVLHGVGRCAESALAKFRDLRIAGPLAQETNMCVCVCMCVCFGPT